MGVRNKNKTSDWLALGDSSMLPIGGRPHTQHLEPYSMVFMEMNRKINRFTQIIIAQHISSLRGQKYLNNGILTVRLLKLPTVLGKL